MFDSLPTILGVTVVATPTLLAAVLGIASLADYPLGERVTGRLVQFAIVIGLGASVAMLGLMLAGGARQVPVELGSWVQLGHASSSPGEHSAAATAEVHYHFALKLMFDRLSVPFVILTFVLCGTIGAFATRYLHREPGFNRFFVLYAFFVLGMTLASLAGTIETLFTGWEIVGITSALLVAFFQERPAPVRNGLRVWAVYRIADAALLVAAIAMHHLVSQGDFGTLMGNDAWPYGHAVGITERQAFIIGLLLLIAAAGKSALVPFSGWLPRAMEGPTPSSAIFYGALSVHLGAFLLLRVSPLIEMSLALQVAVVSVGLATAAFAAIAGRVQTDIKSALSFASLTQVGIIVAEIGLGLEYLALAHIIGHACLRTLQFLRASSLLQDYRSVENALGARLASPRAQSGPSGLWQLRLYRFATERGYLDAALQHYVARPFLGLFRACDALERRWTNLLAGGRSRESDNLAPNPAALDELR